MPVLRERLKGVTHRHQPVALLTHDTTFDGGVEFDHFAQRAEQTEQCCIVCIRYAFGRNGQFRFCPEGRGIDQRMTRIAQRP